jgi:hypothetical protein
MNTTTTAALGRLYIAEAFAGHIIGGSTEEANTAVDDAIAALIATVEVVAGKLDRAWQFYSDDVAPVGDELRAIPGKVTKGQRVARVLEDLAESLGPGVCADLVRSAATDATALEAA